MISAEVKTEERVDATRAFLSAAVLMRIALVLTFLVYVRTIAFDFVYDDHLQIALNPWLDSWRQMPEYFTHQLWAFSGFRVPANYYRPIFLVWLAGIKQLSGGAPGWYHLATIILHLIVVGEAFLLARLLLKDSVAAAMAAALFALHPGKVEAVAWVSAGGEPLWAAFFFATFICYLRGRESEHRTGWTLAAIACFVLALLSKEQAIVAPVIIAAYEFWAYRDERFLSRLKNTFMVVLPFVLMSAIHWAIRSHVLHGWTEFAGSISGPKTLLTQPIGWLWYVVHLLFPYGLSLTYPEMIVRNFSVSRVLLPALGLVAIGGVAWRFARRSPEGAFLFAWFVLTLAPPLAMVLLLQPHDRYLYVPSFAAAVALAAIIRKYLPGEKLQVAAVSGICLVLAIESFHTTRYWDNDISLMERSVETAPDNISARIMLGTVYAQQGEMERSFSILREASRRDPASFDVWHTLGIQELTVGRNEQAYADLKRALDNAKYFYQDPMCRYDLGMVSMRLNRPAEAETWLREAIAKDPKAAAYHTGLAAVLDAQGRRSEALIERNVGRQNRQ